MIFRIHFWISRTGSPNLGPLNLFETILQTKSNDIHSVFFQQFSEIRKMPQEGSSFSFTLNRKLSSASEFPQFTTGGMIRPVPCKLVATASNNANSERFMLTIFDKPNFTSL